MANYPGLNLKKNIFYLNVNTPLRGLQHNLFKDKNHMQDAVTDDFQNEQTNTNTISGTNKLHKKKTYT